METLHERPRHFVFVFLAFVFISMFPLWGSTYFPALDSPAHLYNAKLILALLNDDSPMVHQFYYFNPLVVPNWIGHALLALFYCLFGEWWMAEKCLLVLYFIAIPLGFDLFIRSVGGNRWLSFWSLPFVFSFVFSIGFYNYSLSIVFALLFLSKSWHFFEKQFSWKEYLTLLSLLLLLYFSHGFTFLLTLLVWGSASLPVLWHQWKIKPSLRPMIQRLMQAILLVLPLVILYKWNTAYHTGSPSYLRTTDLIKDLLRWRSLIVYHEGKEERWTVLMSLLTMVLLCWIFVRSKMRFVLAQQRLVVSMVLLLVMYFLLPDNTGSAGFISVRIQGWLAMLTILLIAVSVLPIRLLWMTTVMMFIGHFALVNFHAKVVRKDSILLEQCSVAQQYIPDHSILHFEDLSKDWRFQHFSNFIALQSKDVVCTENYEASVDYFPLCFRPTDKPDAHSSTCIEQKIIMKPAVMDSIYWNVLKQNLHKGNLIVFENESIVLLKTTK